ncbi:MAG TPA: DUF92 domain-containing protein [Gemmatimonadaceae bacterium]|nr:DUF92 domain-containing protein [Gemmatimonadaceae bacterium]
MIERALAGLLVAATVALAARRAHALSLGGVAAAVGVGGAAVAAGWGWGVLLIGYFVASIALSRLRGAEKAQRTGDVVAKGGARDAFQVVANGGLFAVMALAAEALAPGSLPARTFAAAALGALAASAADTWATEIGSLASRPPRSILTWRPVAPGTSGGVNLLGMLAMVAGAAFVAFGGRVLAIEVPIAAVVLAGFLGAIADSIVGATLQDRRWCDTCQKSTERMVHGCGTPTRHAGGLTVVDNDLVNLIATFAGAAIAALIVHSRAAA